MMNFNTCVIAILLLFFSLGFVNAQVCEPDTTVTSLGLFPSSLPDGEIGTPYSSTLNAGLPRDTTLFSQVFDFCFYRIDSTQPALSSLGLQFECDQPNCQYTVDQSLPLNFGCVVVSGTPTALFDDSVRVFVKAAIGNYDSQTQVCTVTDSTTFQALEFLVPFKILMGTNVSLPTETFGTVKISPNPTQSVSALTFELQEPQKVNVEVQDLRGRVIRQAFEGNLFPGQQRVEVSTLGLAEGMYLLRLSTDKSQQVVTRKLIVNR